MGKNLIEATNKGCKFSKTFKFESKCEGKFLYLVRGADDTIEELCVKDITDPATQA